MSQIRLTSAERIHALQRMGYSEREADFLCLAALHGGYFLRRQYCQFLNKAVGGTAASLIEKVLGNGHGRVTTYAAKTGVYHLGARPFYNAIGQKDNRNRRERSLEAVKSKLIGLDFVLAHLRHEYLATEQEKLDYFVRILGLDQAVLPTKRYAGSGSVTDRYFVEKFPLFLSEGQGSASPVVSFCFVDSGATGVDGFTTFLSRYSRLLRELRQSHIIYVAATERLFGTASRLFERFVAPEVEAVKASSVRELSLELAQHFQSRRRFERQEWAAFDRATLLRFRDERQRFAGDLYEELYKVWCKTAREGLGFESAPNSQNVVPLPSGRVRFSTYRCVPSYELFGNSWLPKPFVRRQRRAPRCRRG
jgi:hypothetical protein